MGNRGALLCPCYPFFMSVHFGMTTRTTSTCVNANRQRFVECYCNLGLPNCISIRLGQLIPASTALPTSLARMVSSAERMRPAFPQGALAKRVQAGHWINFPLLLSQPIVPVALVGYSLVSVIIGLALVLTLNLLWIRVISQVFVSLPLARLGEYIAKAKWLACPLAAIILWREGSIVESFAALTWPALLLPLLYAFHRFWPPQALADTQRKFQQSEVSAAKR